MKSLFAGVLFFLEGVSERESESRPKLREVFTMIRFRSFTLFSAILFVFASGFLFGQEKSPVQKESDANLLKEELFSVTLENHEARARAFAANPDGQKDNRSATN